MSWLSNFVRPKIQSLVRQKEIPDNLWTKCPGCGAMLFARELEQNFMVCHHCDYHMRLGAEGRLSMLFDDGKFTRIELPEVAKDTSNLKTLKNILTALKILAKKRARKMQLLLVMARWAVITWLLPLLILPLWVAQWERQLAKALLLLPI